MTIQLYEDTAMTNDVATVGTKKTNKMLLTLTVTVRVNRKKKNKVTHEVTDHRDRGIRIGPIHIHVSIDHRATSTLTRPIPIPILSVSSTTVINYLKESSHFIVLKLRNDYSKQWH